VNPSKTFERALCQIISEQCVLGAGVVLRPWQSLREFASKLEKQTQSVDVRASGMAMDESANAFFCVVSVFIRTNADDDKTHEAASGIEGEIVELLYTLHAEHLAGAGDTYDAFAALVLADDPSLIVGGVMLVDGEAPYDDDGENTLNANIRVSFAVKPTGE